MDTLYNGFTKQNELTSHLPTASIKPDPSSSTAAESSSESKIKQTFIVNSARFSREFNVGRLASKKSVNSNDPLTPNSFTAFEATVLVDGINNIDIRPRLLDKNTDKLTLIDSGSQICVVAPDPGDKVDSSISIESVGGDKVPCYGKKNITIKINRKDYHIEEGEELFYQWKGEER